VSRALANQHRILRFSLAPPNPDLIGHKAVSLIDLEASDLSVPPWVCVSTQAHDAFRTEKRLSDDDRAELLTCFDQTFPSDALVAVRASPVGEDYDSLPTFMPVFRDQVVERVEACLAAAASPRVLFFRKVRGLTKQPLRIAVIVQQLVDARASGILLTLDPETGDPTRSVVLAGRGSNARRSDPGLDNYATETHTGMIQARHVGDRPGEREGQPLLSDADLTRLTSCGRKLKEHQEGADQEITWAIDRKGQPQLLQARPLKAGERERVFDSSRALGAYPGLTRPLDYSVARRAHERVFRAAARALGAPAEALDEHDAALKNLLGLIDGRIYHDLFAWYRLLQQLPRRGALLPGIDASLGLPANRLDAGEPPGLLARWGAALARARLGRRLRKDVARLTAVVDELQAELDGRDLARMTPDELLDLHERFSGRFLGPFHAAVVARLLLDQSTACLRAQALAWEIKDADGMLTYARSGSVSGAAWESLSGLIEAARADTTLALLLRSDRPSLEVWEELNGGAHDGFGRQLEAHLRDHGDQALRELALEPEVAAASGPSLAVGVLRLYTREARDAAQLQAHAAGLLEALRAALVRSLRLPPWRWVRFALEGRRQRKLLVHWEALNRLRARVEGMSRAIFAAVGEALASRKLLPQPDDLAWLTVDEVRDQVAGHSVNQDLRAPVYANRLPAAAAPPSRRSTT
jgi:pyruvate,water dikinase